MRRVGDNRGVSSTAETDAPTRHGSGAGAEPPPGADPEPSAAVSVAEEPAPTAAAAPDAALRCARCARRITDAGARTSVRGKHVHTRVNPGGWVHQFGCFRAAPGAVAAGEPTEEHTWFAGYAWSLAHCARCAAHLGWRFVGEGEFYGLLLERLRPG